MSSAPLAARRRNQKLAGRDDQLFVRDRDALAAFDRRKDRIERDRAVGCSQDDVRPALGRDHQESCGTVRDLRRGGQGETQRFGGIDVLARDEVRGETARLR